jgi:hypothetical protein
MLHGFPHRPGSSNLRRRSAVAGCTRVALIAVAVALVLVPSRSSAQAPGEAHGEPVDSAEPIDTAPVPATPIERDPVPPVDADLFEAERTDDAVAPPADHVSPGEDSLSHEDQVGIRLGAAVPFVFAIRYGEGPRCAAGEETFCRRLGVGLFDIDLSYGLSRSVEVSVLGRIGLATDEASGGRPFVLGIGLRGYVSADSAAKVYAGGKLIFDITAADEAVNPDWGTLDVGLRGEFGVAVDFVRYFGLFAQVGLNLQVLRGLYLIGDLSGGVQARFP